MVKEDFLADNMNWRTMKQFHTIGIAPLIAIVAAFILSSTSAVHAQTTNYIVLSTSQVLINSGCKTGCSASISPVAGGGSTSGVAAAALEADINNPSIHRPDPDWTVVSFSAVEFQFSQKTKYTLTFTSKDATSSPATSVIINIDTEPAIQFSQGQSSRIVNLISNIAFALPGSAIALQEQSVACPKNAPHQFARVMLEYPELEISLQKVPFCQVDLSDLDPRAVGVILGTLIHQSSKSSGRKSATPSTPILGLTDVLGDQLIAPKAPTLSQPKAPTTEGSAWLWINGTITAGTGTSPAWDLTGKLAPFTSLTGTTKWTWGEADADIGNNKINGQSAKDVIDFIGPYPTYYGDWRAVGTKVSLSPTYETNRELNHRNMLAVADAVWDFADVNQTVLVRNAEANRKDLTKMPRQGDFVKGKSWGESFEIHTGFEGGGALAPVTVTNSKTKAIVGTIPTYSIARFVPQFDGTVQYRWFTIESDFTGRYLGTTEHTAVNDKNGNPYLETVTGWKAVNVLTTTYSPGSNQNIKITITYTNGFAAPTYQRANGIKIGVTVAY
jgi:hypothetical protein